MATIKIQRFSKFLNRTGNFKIYIDDKFVWSTYDNLLESIEVGSGCHTIQAKSGWASSRRLSFEVIENEFKTFEVGTFKLNKYLEYLGPIVILLLALSRSYSFLKYSGLLFIPIILIMVYYSTFGVRRYFTLTEIKLNK